MSFLDGDVNKLLSALKNPEKQQGWIEKLQSQFCEIMENKPNVITGTSEYFCFSRENTIPWYK